MCRLANGLKSIGVKKGDRVTIYLSMVPELAYSMLACARIGAIHSVVFGGFSPDSLAGRIRTAIPASSSPPTRAFAATVPIPLKANVDAALESCPTIEKCIVVKRTGGDHRLGGRTRRPV